MFCNGAYAKLWEIKEIKERSADVRISTSSKNKDGKYEQDFGGYVRMIGKALEALNHDLHENDRFKIVRCGVTNRYDKEKKITYNNFAIFEVEPAEEAEHPLVGSDENPFL